MASADAVVAQGLECCLCFEYFNEPKNLSCGHSFCKECLVLLYESHQENQLSCPICRQITTVNYGDISKLQTNILLKSMVDDAKAGKRICTACDPEAKSPAVQYCAQCHEYMCDPCAVAHGKFKMSKKHDVFSMEDIKGGMVKVKRLCAKHPEEEKLYVCTTCNVSICFRCRVLDHGKSNHTIKEVADYKKIIQKQIESLQTKAENKIKSIDAHAVYKHQVVVEVVFDKKIAEINQSYEQTVASLTWQRDDLIKICKREKATHIAQLKQIEESDDRLKSRIQSSSKLVGNGIKALLERQTLAVHNTICCDLEKMLDRSNPDTAQPESIAKSAKRVKFIESRTPNRLGKLELWQLEQVATFPLSHDDPWDAVPLPDGRVAVGYGKGKAIEMFTADGPQEKVALRGVYVHCVSVLTDGRYVVRDDDNDITLYTPTFERLNVHFNTLSSHEGAWGGMCVDRDGNIYVGYVKKKKIMIFRPEGGEPYREIDCHGMIPTEISHMNHSRKLVVCEVMSEASVEVIDDRYEAGDTYHHIQVAGQTRITVLKNDSILIAFRKNGLMSIELYTNDLTKISTVLIDFPLADLINNLSELPTGEIVLLPEKQVIIFRKL